MAGPSDLPFWKPLKPCSACQPCWEAPLSTWRGLAGFEHFCLWGASSCGSRSRELLWVCCSKICRDHSKQCLFFGGNYIPLFGHNVLLFGKVAEWFWMFGMILYVFWKIICKVSNMLDAFEGVLRHAVHSAQPLPTSCRKYPQALSAIFRISEFLAFVSKSDRNPGLPPETQLSWEMLRDVKQLRVTGLIEVYADRPLGIVFKSGTWGTRPWKMPPPHVSKIHSLAAWVHEPWLFLASHLKTDPNC